MYETAANMPTGERCKEPDWEKEYADKKKQYDGIVLFKTQLFEFIKIIGVYSFRQSGKGQMADFLGTIEIDLMQREQELERLAKKIERET